MIATALRSGYGHYLAYYLSEAKAEAALDTRLAIELARQRLPVLDEEGSIWPMPAIHLSLSALTAIAGGYLWVATQLIQSCRSRTLVYSDLFNAALRILVAVPMGLSVSVLAPDSIGPFIAFGLGAFPIGKLTSLIQRLTSMSLNAVEAEHAATDQLVAMLGVTQLTTEVLNAEGISCPQQLADIDPVVLAVRSGLPFDYVIALSAQALVWCYLGSTAGLLGPLGLGDARPIKPLMDRLGSVDRDAANEVLAATARAVGIDAGVLASAFDSIARDDYTVFLFGIS